MQGTSGPNSISDANGNSITSDGAGNFTDTLGVVALQVAGGTQPTTFTYPVAKQANGATTATATITYGTYTIQTNFQAINMWTEFGPVAGVSLPSQIALADGSTYQFTYEPTPGFAGNVTGRLATVTLPSGGLIQYTYPGCNKNGGMQPDGSPCLMQRTIKNDLQYVTKSYYHSPATASPYATSIVDEAGNETDYQFQLGANGNAYEVHHTTYQGAPGSTDLMEYDVYYNSDWGRSQTISTISAVDVTQAQNGQRLSHTTANLNSLGQAATLLERDNADTLLRQTTNTYDSNHNLKDQLIADGSGNMVAHTSYGYDETAAIATGNIPQHGTANSSPGNVTSTQHWLDGTNHLDTTSVYYDTGAVKSTTTPSGTTGYIYDATQAFVTQTILPTPSSGVALSTSANYDKTSAALLSTTGLNAGQTVSVTQYDPLSRPTLISKPDGGTTKIIYWSGGVSYNSPLDGSKYAFQQTVYDGYGRVRRTAVYNGTAWYLTDACYTATGQVQAVSIPYLSTAADPTTNHCAAATANTYTYDALGRVKSVTHPDGKQVLSSYFIYNGAFSTLNTDELEHTKVTDTDALGRPVIACEVSTTTQANGEAPTVCNTAIGKTGFKTTYSYTNAMHTTTVTQGAQTRTVQTDALGRTTMTSEPERKSTFYTYTYQGNQLQVQRARAQANQPDPGAFAFTTTTYDTLSRPITVAYTATYPTARTLQATRRFSYDGTGVPGTGSSRGSSYASANAKGLLTQAYLDTGDSNDASTRFTYDIMGRVAGMDECTPGWCSQEATRAMYRGYAYDYTGNNTVESWTIASNGQGGFASVGLTRTFTVAGELDSMQGGVSDGGATVPNGKHYQAGVHTPQGPVTETFGNGLVRNSIYDVNGMDTGKFVCSGTVQPDCQGGTYFYGYRDTIVGQQATHLGDTSLQRTSDMQYDDLGRLKALTSDSGFQMSWTYDRYGNRYTQSTNVSQPGSSVAAYDVSSNRVTSSGTPSSPSANPASYDAAGNMLSEGLHGYTYDQEGNLLTVDNSTVTNYYDALNRRVAQSTPNRFERYEYNAAGQVSEVWYNEEPYEHITRYTANGMPLAYWTSNGNTANQKIHFQHPDYLGTVRYMTSDTGVGESAFRSTPFGEGYSFIGTSDDRTHFAELEHDDDSNTDHAQYRQYSSLLGRWHSPDPYDGSYDPNNPQSFNRYNYVLNRPFSFIDPSGLDCNYTFGPDQSDGHGGVIAPIIGVDCNGAGLPFSFGAIGSPTNPRTYGDSPTMGTNSPTTPAPNNGRNCSVSPASAGQYAAATAEVATLTAQYASGLGPGNRTFGPDTATSQVLGQSAGVQEVLGAYLLTGQTSGLYSFGASGAYVAGGNPVAQFVGSFRYSISGGVLSITNTTSFRSLTYDRGPQYQRGSFPTPGGNTHQTYQIGVTCH